MTEEEAKQRWCPFARIYSTEGLAGCNGSWNRHPKNGETETLCIGSACMAWRDGEFAYFDEFDRPISSTSRHRSREKPLGGYCGLAGKP